VNDVGGRCCFADQAGCDEQRRNLLLLLLLPVAVAAACTQVPMLLPAQTLPLLRVCCSQLWPALAQQWMRPQRTPGVLFSLRGFHTWA
jgi:hypothetical protein